jgi:DNA-binding beta-propeller fold protein YncE
MNREIAQINRITGSQFFTRVVGFGVLKVFAATVISCLICSAVLMADDNDLPFLPDPVRAVSTVPGNGDVNPYGVAFAPPGFPAGGALNVGDILVSNFNNSMNLQGTGTTIIDVPANAPVFQFFGGTGSLGLTTALNILRRGFVLVGNFPSPKGLCTDPGTGSGSILVIDKNGKLLSTITDPLIQGPWDSALFDKFESAKLFVANALTGTVVRLDLDVDKSGVSLEKATQIASGYLHNCDAVTFVDAPTGLVYDANKDVLYVASAADNAVYAVSDAGERKHDGGVGKLIYTDSIHLHGPLGMAMAPNGDLLVSNNDVINSDPNQPSEIVEFTVDGEFVKEISVDPAQGGAFGLAMKTMGKTTKLAAVDDATNLFLIWTLNLQEKGSGRD